MSNRLVELLKKNKLVRFIAYDVLQIHSMRAIKNQINALEAEMKSLREANRELNREIVYNYFKLLTPDQYPAELKIWYQKQTGKPLNLIHPRSYNEKIQWMKLYDNSPLKSFLADKYLVRDWVKEKIGADHLVPLLGVWDQFDEIDFNTLPNKFVLKANHGCNWNILVKDKASFDVQAAKRKFDNWMSKDYSFVNGLELHYKDIPRKIIAEKLLESTGDLRDYKFFCFDGNPCFVWVDLDRSIAHKRNFYDLDWNPLKISMRYPNSNSLDDKPVNLDKMIEFSKILSAGLNHIRVDFYEIDGKVYFSEMTFTTHSGTCEWEPPELNDSLGELIKLSFDKPKQL
jgi:hypothetical protein